jgi:hypothetical protein
MRAPASERLSWPVAMPPVKDTSKTNSNNLFALIVNHPFASFGIKD